MCDMNTSFYTKYVLVGIIFGACIGVLGASFSFIIFTKQSQQESMAVKPTSIIKTPSPEVLQPKAQAVIENKSSSCIGGYQLKSSFTSGTSAFIKIFPDAPDDSVFARDKNGYPNFDTEITLKQGETKEVFFAGGATGPQKVYISLDWIDSHLLSDAFLAAHFIVVQNGSTEEGMVQGDDPVVINGVTFQLKHGDLISPTFIISVPAEQGQVGP